MTKTLSKKQAEDDLNLFLMQMDDWLEELIDKASHQGFNLDYSLESLYDLARFIKVNHIINNKENINDFVNCWVYLGETFRKQTSNAYWDIGCENKKNMNYGLYFLSGYDEEMSEFIPILYVNNFTCEPEDDLEEDFFYELVKFELNPIIPNLDYLPTEKD